MNLINQIIDNITNHYTTEAITTMTLLSMLSVVLCLALYEYFIYRLVSHRSFFNKSFNIAIAIIPFFISTIILCLQSNIVITLGTIGALAIIRFRTAVKDPVDMVYLLWSIHTGIICGCQLYEVAVLTSIIVTLFLIIFSYVKVGKKSYCMVIRITSCDNEPALLTCLKEATKTIKIKTRTYSGKNVDYVIECSLKNPAVLASALEKETYVERFSLIEYDMEDIV